MKTYYLKANSEAELWSALEAAGLAYKEYDMEDPLNVAPDDYDPEAGPFVKTGKYDWVAKTNMLDIIGTVYKPTGVMLTDADGYEYPEMTAVEGFHANLKAEEGITGLPTVAAPKTPHRKWAGENN